MTVFEIKFYQYLKILKKESHSNMKIFRMQEKS